MTTDQYKSDVQTLEMILEGDKEFLQAHYIRDLNHFHDAVTTLWGLDERYHSTVFISFMHYLTDNNAAVLKRLKLQTLCEREELFRKAGEMEYLSHINHLFLTEICKLLGIDTKITWSSDYTLADGKTERLAELVKSAGGSYYLSGPAAKDYIVDEVFENAGIELEYMDYSGYPEYPQLHGEFTPNVSVLDLLFMTGPNAPKYMKSFH